MPAPRRGATRTRLAVDVRRDQLLRIGTEFFAAQPYEDVSIEAIARRAGVSRGLLYHYYPTKRDFYVAVIRGRAAAWSSISQPVAAVGTAQRLRRGLDAYLDYVEREATGYQTLHRGGTSDPELRAIVEGSKARHVDGILTVLTGGGHAPAALRLAVQGWLGFVQETCLRWLDERVLDREQLRELLLHALGGAVHGARAADASIAASVDLRIGRPGAGQSRASRRAASSSGVVTGRSQAKLRQT